MAGEDRPADETAAAVDDADAGGEAPGAAGGEAVEDRGQDHGCDLRAAGSGEAESPGKDPILDHEIAHAHPADDSLHVWLSDPDARTVIEAGWGQRFPLTFVKSGWMMVYAPRNLDEVEMVEEIVRAGIAWITGVEV